MHDAVELCLVKGAFEFGAVAGKIALVNFNDT